jgi:hypothetical protein
LCALLDAICLLANHVLEVHPLLAEGAQPALELYEAPLVFQIRDRFASKHVLKPDYGFYNKIPQGA